MASDPKGSWTAFWSYQMIGKGFFGALALSSTRFSAEQIRRLLIFLLLMLVARNIAMVIYGYQHPVFLGGTEYAVEEFLLGYRRQGDHLLVLFPFILAAAFVWEKYKNVVLSLMCVEILLLASTGWRGAWMGFAGGCLMLLVMFRAWGMLVVLAIGSIAVAVIGLAASSTNIVAMAISRGFGDSNRVNMVWKPVLDMLAQSNWQGYGFGQSRYLELISTYSAVHPERAIPVLGDAHNMILNFAMAAGWLGAFAFVVTLVCGMVLCLLRLRDKTVFPEQTILLAGTAAAWLATYGLLGLTDQPHYNNLAVLAVLTSVALASSRTELRR
ncbi:O-antigen ligase family protein [Dechloromonas denitrificans]|nr:O-antigen ligase family protein [Dechloromonas denitrificans]